MPAAFGSIACHNMPDRQQPEAWLQNETNETFPLTASFSVGRSSSCDLPLADSKVSRKHAVINRQADGEYWLSDLGSANGTYVNQMRVAQPVRLRAGDEIRVGSFLFEFVCPSDQATLTGPATQVTTQQTIIDVRHELRWLLVADIENSTMLASRLDPAVYRRQVDEWFALSREVIAESRGTINKFLGDGFLACWSANDSANERVLATLNIFRKMREKVSFPFRVALHIGEVLLGGLGTTGEESLSGPEVNFVFRMEKVAGTNGIGILISEPAVEAFGERFKRSEPHGFAVPGFSGNYQFYEA